MPCTQNFQVLIYLWPLPMRSCGLTQFPNSGCLPFGFYDSEILYSVNNFLLHCICQIIKHQSTSVSHSLNLALHSELSGPYIPVAPPNAQLWFDTISKFWMSSIRILRLRYTIFCQQLFTSLYLPNNQLMRHFNTWINTCT